MKIPLSLVGLVARRFLSPTGLLLLAAALALALVLPWSPSEVRGAGELSSHVSAGLARQGVWICGLGIALPWFAVRAGTCVRQWRRGEGDWLGTCALSRFGVAWNHALGASLALALALLPFALASELRAGDTTPPLRWLADANVQPVVLLTEFDRATLTVDPPRGAVVAVAHFVVAAPGSGGPHATVRCTIERAGAAGVSSETLVSDSTPLELVLPGGAGQARFSFERVGPGAVVVLEGPRLQWFAPKPARWTVALSLFLHAWLAGSAAAAIALGVAAWTSPATASLAALVVLACAWLADQAPLSWPGVGLRGALELSGEGLGSSFPAWSTWLGCALVVCAAPLLAAIQRDLWRRES